MGRLIDADVLKENISKVTVTVEGMRSGKSLLNEVLSLYRDAILKEFDIVSTIDAEPVIRCKDCKYLRLDNDFMAKRYCALRNVNGGGFCEDDDFCSYGVRRKINEAD